MTQPPSKRERRKEMKRGRARMRERITDTRYDSENQTVVETAAESLFVVLESRSVPRRVLVSMGVYRCSAVCTEVLGRQKNNSPRSSVSNPLQVTGKHVVFLAQLRVTVIYKPEKTCKKLDLLFQGISPYLFMGLSFSAFDRVYNWLD